MKTLRLIIAVINLQLIISFYFISDLSAFIFLLSAVHFTWGYIFGILKHKYRFHSLTVWISSILPAVLIILLNEFLFTSSMLQPEVVFRILLIAIVTGIASYLIGYFLVTLITKVTYRNSLFAGIAILFATTPINSYSSAVHLSILGLCYIVASFVLNFKSREKYLLQGFIVFMPFFILILVPSLIFKMPRAYPSLVVVPISIFWGWALAILLKKSRIISFSICTLFSSLLVVMYYFAMLNWLAYLSTDNTLHYDSRKLQSVLKEAGIIFVSTEHLNRDSETLSQGIKVLYFFTRYCGVCFEKMPELEALHQEFLYDSQVEIIAVNIQARHTDTLFDYPAYYYSKGYTFPFQTVGPEYGARLLEHLNIRGFPHVIVIDGNFHTLFVGGFQTRDIYLIGNIRKIIENNLM
jgi:thiol-disulfide isomerase/thioredoxin